MAWDGIAERRGSPRVQVEEPTCCRLVVRARVNLLDVSLTGALLSSETPLPASGRGELTAALPTGRFSSAVEIRRVRAGLPKAQQELAAVFTAMDAESRKELKAFLRADES